MHVQIELNVKMSIKFITLENLRYVKYTFIPKPLRNKCYYESATDIPAETYVDNTLIYCYYYFLQNKSGMGDI